MKLRLSNRKMRISIPVALFCTLALAPKTAFAAEGAELDGSFLIPAAQEFFPMLIVFVIFWAIVAKVAWPAIAETLDKRAATIKDSLESAEAARIEATQLLEEYKAQLAEARKESAEIIAEAKRAGETVRNDLLAKAQVEAEDMVERARLTIESEKKAAIKELQASVADLSVGVASKIVHRDLSTDDHLQLIENYLEEVGTIDEN